MSPTLTRLLLAALLVTGLVLRLPTMSMGWAPDELALLYGQAWWRIPCDPESAVNPPLLRTALNLLAPEPWVLPLGRAVSLVAGLAIIPLSWRLGVHVGGPWAGLLTAALWATHPRAVEMSTQSRVYALFCLVATWHALSLIRWLPDRRQAQVPLMVSAALLPQLHYFGVLMLMYLALLHLRSAPGLVLRYLPAAAGIIPLLPLIFGTTQNRVAVPGRWIDAALPIFSTTLEPPITVIDALPRLPYDTTLYAALFWAVLVLAHTAAAPWLDVGRRTLTFGAIACTLSVATFLPFQFPRSPIGLYLLVFLAPLLGAVASLARGTVSRALVTVAITVTLGGAIRGSMTLDGYPEDGSDWFLKHWQQFDTIRAGRPIALHPGYALVLAYYQLRGDHTMNLREPVGDLPKGSAFLHDDVVFRRARQPERGALLAVFDAYNADEAIQGCVILHRQKGLVVADCPESAP